MLRDVVRGLTCRPLPEQSALTPYDQEHAATYMRLLDADAEGADWCCTSIRADGGGYDVTEIAKLDHPCRHLCINVARCQHRMGMLARTRLLDQRRASLLAAYLPRHGQEPRCALPSKPFSREPRQVIEKTHSHGAAYQWRLKHE